MNQFVIAILATIAGIATLRVFVAKDVGIHGGALILRIVFALAAFAALVSFILLQ